MSARAGPSPWPRGGCAAPWGFPPGRPVLSVSARIGPSPRPRRVGAAPWGSPPGRPVLSMSAPAGPPPWPRGVGAAPWRSPARSAGPVDVRPGRAAALATGQGCSSWRSSARSSTSRPRVGRAPVSADGKVLAAILSAAGSPPGHQPSVPSWSSSPAASTPGPWAIAPELVIVGGYGHGPPAGDCPESPGACSFTIGRVLSGRAVSCHGRHVRQVGQPEKPARARQVSRGPRSPPGPCGWGCPRAEGL